MICLNTLKVFEIAQNIFLELHSLMYVKHCKFSHIEWLRKLKNCGLLQKNYTEEEKINSEFFLFVRFMGGIACTDGTHIPIIASIDE